MEKPINNNLNFGLDLAKHEADKQRPTNYKFGAVEKQVLRSDGQWLDFDPECEIQKGDEEDWMDCVSESDVNDESLILQRKFNIKNNWSQRKRAKESGTTHSGNSLYAVADSAKNKGLCLEMDWPRDRTMNWNEYYAPLSANAVAKGKQYVAQFDVNYEQVPTNQDALMEALKYAPVQVIGYAWASYEGIYYDYGYAPNHAFLLVGYVKGKYWIVYDSYPTDFLIDNNSTKQEFIKHLDWNFKFGDALLYSIKLKSTDKRSWLYKLMDKFKNIVRDVHGALWFRKVVEKNGTKFTGKQKIENWLDFAGAVIDDVGCNTISDDDLNKCLDYKFFGH
jgi:hypothetical protein